MSNPFSYSAKSVVVTGASSGVGAALVQMLRELDAQRIVAVDRRPCDGPVDHFVQADLSDPEAIDAVIESIEGEVHALFANAGVAATLPAPVVMAVNAFALRRLSFGLLPQMPAGAAIAVTASTGGGGWGAHLPGLLELVAIDDWDSSLSWVADHPDEAADVYAFSKEYAQVFTMWASKQTTERGVRVNSVCPGVIETPLLTDFNSTMGEPLLDWMISQGNGHSATPEQIAAVLAFLGSDASGYLNGANVIADGGFTGAMNTNQVDFAALG